MNRRRGIFYDFIEKANKNGIPAACSGGYPVFKDSVAASSGNRVFKRFFLVY